MPTKTGGDYDPARRRGGPRGRPGAAIRSTIRGAADLNNAGQRHPPWTYAATLRKVG